MNNWFGVVAPVRIPKDIVNKLANIEAEISRYGKVIKAANITIER